MTGWLFAVLVGGALWLWWEARRAPKIDESRCPSPHLLAGGECEGACDRHPPCTRERR